MENEEKPDISRGANDAESRLRLRQAREAAGKSPEELAFFVGNSVSAYYDLENCDGEISTNVSLGQLSALCSALGITPFALFTTGLNQDRPISPEQLRARIRSHVTSSNLTVSAFEDRVGFTVEPTLRDPSEVSNWNVDCLRSVCTEIGVDWLEALPVTVRS